MYNGEKRWTLVGDGLDRGVLSLAVYNGELYAGAGRGVFRVYKAWVFKRRYYELDVSCGYPWRGLFVSRGFLLIGDSLYDRIGRWDGRRFYADVDAGGYDFAVWGVYLCSCLRWCALSVPGWFSVGAGFGLLRGREYVVFGGI